MNEDMYGNSTTDGTLYYTRGTSVYYHGDLEERQRYEDENNQDINEILGTASDEEELEVITGKMLFDPEELYD